MKKIQGCGEMSIHSSNTLSMKPKRSWTFLRIQQRKHSNTVGLFTMNTIILFTTFLFVLSSSNPCHLRTQLVLLSKKLHCPMNGQKFALLLPKSFVKSNIAFMVQTCHFCVYKSLKKMQFNCLNEFYYILFRSFIWATMAPFLRCFLIVSTIL